jgi:hypothetical protein
MNDLKAKIKSEVFIWTQYLCISLVAATLAADKYESSLRPVSTTAIVSNSDANPNIVEMIRALWINYYEPFILTFIVLGLLRLGLLFLPIIIREFAKKLNFR